MRNQTLIWTALPNGRPDGSHLALSVFLTPRLTTSVDGPNPTLAPFTDFLDWPATLDPASGSPISFAVEFGNGASVPATITSLGQLSSARWQAVFNQPSTVAVESYTYTDFSTLPMHSYSTQEVQSYVAALYGLWGSTAVTAPPVFTIGYDGSFFLPGTNYLPQDQRLLGALEAVLNQQIVYNGPYGESSYPPPLADLANYYTRPPVVDPNTAPYTEPFVPTIPTLDFHQAISALVKFPYLLRVFGLVFDLEIPLPLGYSSGVSTVAVTPTFTSAFGPNGTTTNASPLTSCTLTATAFQPTPRGALDYHNGMLDLADTSRFWVTELDVDGAGFSVNALHQDLANLTEFNQSIDNQNEGAQVAVTLPALRSTGPAVIYNDFQARLQELAAQQTTNQNELETAIEGGGAMPVFYAEDVMHGHRFDVLGVDDAEPVWRSLYQRLGSYDFGPGTYGPSYDPNSPGSDSTLALTVLDEGIQVPGATQAAGTNQQTLPPDLYVTESQVTWTGWSLACPRPGGMLDPDDNPAANPANPAAATQDPNGMATPQMSASFQIPTPGNTSVLPAGTPGVPSGGVSEGTLPKLRFGKHYQFRARGVDLAGNSLPVSTTDASTATAPHLHVRHQPVSPPMLASTGATDPDTQQAIAPYTPGTGTLLVALLNTNDNPLVQTIPVQPIGRWLFPPKVAQLLAEEHGMFDGFVLGQGSNESEPMAGDPGTYQLIAGIPGASDHLVAIGRDAAGLPDLPDVLLDAGANDAPYFTDLNPQTPWFPDPMSAGVTLLGLPGDGPTGTRHAWPGGPWPQLNPILLELQAGSFAGHVFTPGTPTQAPIDTVSLPAGVVYDVRISSTLAQTEIMGVLSWMLTLTPGPNRTAVETLAANGQAWLLTPYHTLRMVHATRVPVLAPSFKTPTVSQRPVGATSAQVYDPKFIIDLPSTGSVTVQAVWDDPLDDPTDPNNDPEGDVVSNNQTAFKVTVPDPTPLGADGLPGSIVQPPAPFALTVAPGVTHEFNDTRFHYVEYTVTGTSRYAEFFQQNQTVTFGDTGGSFQASVHGIEMGSLVITEVSTGNILSPSDFDITTDANDVVTISEPNSGPYVDDTIEFSYTPTVTSTGATTAVQILSSARPHPPLVDRVVPAWQLSGPTGSVRNTGITMKRTGGFLRVYLDRPWWSSGAAEMLGVVCLPPADITYSAPSEAQFGLSTLMALDPISLADSSLLTASTPQNFVGTTKIVGVEGRPGYTSPPLVTLAEDPTDSVYQVFPYRVQYDRYCDQWYADVEFQFPLGQEPPPGYFVRLALCRFQPFSEPGVEASPIVQATFAQPVSDRTVSLVQVLPQTLRMFVSGPAYQGFRPAGPIGTNGAIVDDDANVDAPNTYSEPDGGTGQETTSTMIVEVQVQDTSTGLSGDLAWVPAPGIGPVQLTAGINGSLCTWTGDVDLAYPSTSHRPQRIRVSEIDYYTGSGAPASVDTTLRRPFVVHIPIK